METSELQAESWAITGARHGGITVSDMDGSLELYSGLLGLELVRRGKLPASVIGRIVDVPEATGVDVAFLRIPGSETQAGDPVEMTTGPNAGGKSLYSLDPAGYAFEFHQRPPHVAG